MARYLVIVESPTKVKTIKKFLGSNYVVMASNGHVRDLPKSQMGVDLENDFEPKYITIRGKGEILAGLRKEVKKADKIYLATDPDREGEAISWHLMKALKLEGKKVYRISFNEITKSAVKASLKNAREIDMDLVDAQQARRVLDRIVGYKISPVLWAKVKRGLSAGRVQSVALRIIADREDEIAAFIPEEYWSLDANFKIKGEKKPLTAKFYGTKDEKITIHNEEELNKILAELEDAEYKVVDVKRGERSKKAPLPFTTSTLQQEASKALNFATSKTMRIAQQLYEGVDIKGSGTVGLNMDQICTIFFSITDSFCKSFISIIKIQISHWLQKLSGRSHIQCYISLFPDLLSCFLCICNTGTDHFFDRIPVIVEFTDICTESICQNYITSGFIIPVVNCFYLFRVFDIPGLRKFSRSKSFCLQKSSHTSI